MIRLGIIGTSFIVPKLVAAASATGRYVPVCLCTRDAASDSARRTLDELGAMAIFNSLEEMLAGGSMDLVYVASPNSLHCSQSLLAMSQGIPALVEKPVVSNTRELKQLIAESQARGTLMMEAMKSSFLPNHHVLVRELHRIGRLRHIALSYAKRSSRYDLYLQGMNPNTFNPAFSSGSTMDLGIYCLYPLVSLFGVPLRQKSVVGKLPSGVDGHGVMLFEYDGFTASVSHSKVSSSYSDCEFQGEQGTLLVKDISTFESVSFVGLDGRREDISVSQHDNEMIYMMEHVAELVAGGKEESPVNTHRLSLEVMGLLDSSRSDAGVVFPADYTQGRSIE